MIDEHKTVDAMPGNGGVARDIRAARAAIEAERQERAARAAKRVEEILRDENCILTVRAVQVGDLVVSSPRMQAEFQVVARQAQE